MLDTHFINKYVKYRARLNKEVHLLDEDIATIIQLSLEIHY